MIFISYVEIVYLKQGKRGNVSSMSLREDGVRINQFQNVGIVQIQNEINKFQNMTNQY